MKTLKKFALIAVLFIMTSGAFAQQALNFEFTDSNPLPGDVYTITADLFFGGVLYSNICTNAQVYLGASNIFPFSVPVDIEKEAYKVRVTLAKNGAQSVWWIWYSKPFNTDYWFNNYILVKGAI
jgi:hypothetical protein